MTLKRPAPLDVELRAEADGTIASLWHGGDLLAGAVRAELELAVPEPPALAKAEAAEARFDQAAHLYPGCFVCGPARLPGDGWRIFAGAIAEGRVAAHWVAKAEFAGPDGFLAPEFAWAALDCPGYFAVQAAAGLALLGRMAVAIHHPVPVEQPLIVQGWAISSDGRKHHAGTAIHADDGRLLASASQTWVTLR